MSTLPFPSPTTPIDDERQVLLGYLDSRGAAVPDPWADRRDGRWHTEESLEQLVQALEQQAATSRRIVEAHNLDDVGQPGERWDGAPPAPLRRVLLHLVQEYARHLGHLDVARELIDGAVGESDLNAD